jgi:hypothetical protein
VYPLKPNEEHVIEGFCTRPGAAGGPVLKKFVVADALIDEKGGKSAGAGGVGGAAGADKGAFVGKIELKVYSAYMGEPTHWVPTNTWATSMPDTVDGKPVVAKKGSTKMSVGTSLPDTLRYSVALDPAPSMYGSGTTTSWRCGGLEGTAEVSYLDWVGLISRGWASNAASVPADVKPEVERISASSAAASAGAAAGGAKSASKTASGKPKSVPTGPVIDLTGGPGAAPDAAALKAAAASTLVLDVMDGTSTDCHVIDAIVQPSRAAAAAAASSSGSVAAPRALRVLVPKAAVGGSGSGASSSSSSAAGGTGGVAASYGLDEFKAAAAAAHVDVEPVVALQTLMSRMKAVAAGRGEDDDGEVEDAGGDGDGAALVPFASRARGQWKVFALAGPARDSEAQTLAAVVAAKRVVLVKKGDAYVKQEAL